MQTAVSEQKGRIYTMNLQKETSDNHVGFEVLMVVSLMCAVFWVVMPCSPEKEHAQLATCFCWFLAFLVL
jgi:hypothetical protein